uniref:Uncharacterized protein n=1 Tax=Anguilla anguilla TaxID=7936 RepID=A0A0E9PNA9_ANGAN
MVKTVQSSNCVRMVD